jgi:anti-sigma28 factor (negative regulator of flagellin synthesis)
LKISKGLSEVVSCNIMTEKVENIKGVIRSGKL